MARNVSRTLKKMGCFTLLSAGLAVLLPTGVLAASFYQWKDASGVVHVTDNPNAVPSQFRNQSQIEVSPVLGINPPSGKQGGNNYSGSGQKIWKTKCQACHVYNSDVRTSKGLVKGIFSIIINPQTKFPYPEKVIVESIRKAVNGGYEEMPSMAITDKQLKALAKFLAMAASGP